MQNMSPCLQNLCEFKDALSQSEAKRNNCECCKILTAKLCEMQTELSSCREIIQILHDEIHDISLNHQPIENSRNNEPRNPAISGKWTTFSSTKGKYLQYSRESQRQCPLATFNHYSPLANLMKIVIIPDTYPT
jgi:hypothetical protein